MVTIKTKCRWCKEDITFKRKHSDRDTLKRKCPACKEFLYKSKKTDFVIRLGGLLGLLLLLSISVSASNFTDDQICNAIYQAEGAEKAKKPFGILSVSCEGYDGCRQVCLNTVRNNRRRYADWGHKQFDTYLEFLWHRYCPPEAHPLNKNWLGNVKYFLGVK